MEFMHYLRDRYVGLVAGIFTVLGSMYFLGYISDNWLGVGSKSFDCDGSSFCASYLLGGLMLVAFSFVAIGFMVSLYCDFAGYFESDFRKYRVEKVISGFTEGGRVDIDKAEEYTRGLIGELEREIRGGSSAKSIERAQKFIDRLTTELMRLTDDKESGDVFRQLHAEMKETLDLNKASTT